MNAIIYIDVMQGIIVTQELFKIAGPIPSRPVDLFVFNF
jgi:hypothetical protein